MNKTIIKEWIIKIEYGSSQDQKLIKTVWKLTTIFCSKLKKQNTTILTSPSGSLGVIYTDTLESYGDGEMDVGNFTTQMG